MVDPAALKSQIRSCTICPLHKTRVVGAPAWVGDNYDGFAIMGEAPEDDLSGKPFMGRTRALLDSYLSAVGLSRDDVMLLNMLRCRPPYNDIRSSEAIAGLAACDKWTQEEFNVYKPRTVLLCGATSVQLQFGLVSMAECRGAYLTIENRTYVAAYHPAAALRNPDLGKFIVQDLALALELHRERL